MKNYQSTQEGVWVEILNPDLTQEHKLMQELIEEGKHEAIKNLQDAIRVQRESPVDAAIATELNALYATHKPTVEDGVTYQLIAMDVFEKESVFGGILNCRIKGEHIQVRF